MARGRKRFADRHQATGTLVEWWPSSAKLVINKRWRDGIHVHDWKQAQVILEKQFSLSLPPNTREEL